MNKDGPWADDATSSNDGLEEDATRSWETLVTAQNDLFKQVIRRNTYLEKQLAKCEQELSVWRLGYDDGDRKRKETERKLAAAEHANYALQHDNPLAVCLIDGDGAVFGEDFLSRGREGGRAAAAKLMDIIRQHIEEESQESTSAAGSQVSDSYLGGSNARFHHPQQIMATIYLNFSGLAFTLANNNVCSVQDFAEFVVGFNQATPLFTIVDVGAGKEAADAKLRDNLKLYARLNQARTIFFCGAHDNGYTPLLSSLRTEGLLRKLVILKGSSKIAFEVDRFIQETSLKVVEVPGLFLKKKLKGNVTPNTIPEGQGNIGGRRAVSPTLTDTGSVTAPSETRKGRRRAKESEKVPQVRAPSASGLRAPQPPTPSASGFKAPQPPAHNNNSGFKAPQPPQPNTGGSQKSNNPPNTGGSQKSNNRSINPKKPLDRQEPPLCNAFYLNQCTFSNCKYSHDYRLDNAQLGRLRAEVSMTPCTFVLKGQRCAQYASSGQCIYAHNCPNGPYCASMRNNSCKFTGANMHAAPTFGFNPNGMGNPAFLVPL